MKVYLTKWSPKNTNTFDRFYVKDADTQADLGYIQVSFKFEGYGDGYYAAHRAAKGDAGTWEVADVKKVGDEVLLSKVVSAALARSNTAIDNALGLASRNAECFFWGDKKSVKAQRAAQKTLTLDLDAPLSATPTTAEKAEAVKSLIDPNYAARKAQS